MQEKLNSWFSREEKLKEYRFLYQQNPEQILQIEIERMKQNDEMKTKEEKENLQKLEKKIRTISKSKTDSDEDIDSLINEKEKLEKCYEKQKLDRLKEIILFNRETALYLAAIFNKKNYYSIMEKLKELIEEGYNLYENVEYEEIIEQITNQLKCYICPQCFEEVYAQPNIYGRINIIECPACHFEFCSCCYRSLQEHQNNFYFDEDDDYCYNVFNNNSQYNHHESKQISFFIWPMSYEKSKICSAWKKISEQYFDQKQKYDKMHFDFMINKDEKQTEGTRLVSLSKLCVRTRIARVLLRDIPDKNEVKNKTLTILNTALMAQSIITSAYPALFYIIDDPVESHSLTEKMQLLINETDSFIESIYHPEHSSTDELQQKQQTLQKLINDHFIIIK